MEGLDFWIGEWDCAWDGGHGTNAVAPELGGRVVFERFEAFAPEPFTGMSLSTPDPLTGRWRQTWADSDGDYWTFTGGAEPDGTFVFATAGPVDADRLWKRMVFSDIKPNELTWRWEASEDGSTWTERWRIRYRRRGTDTASAAERGRVVIQSERLQLRELVPDDADALAGMFADPEVMTWIGRGGVVERDGALRLLEREMAGYSERGYGEWALALRGSDQMIGLCGLIDWPDLDGRSELEVAFMLGRAWWGRGYATEAATAIRDWAFRGLTPARLVCLVYHDNVASAAVARKLGMSWQKDVVMDGNVVAMYEVAPPP